MRYFLLIFFISFSAKAQFCWKPNDFTKLDGRIKTSDRRVGDVAQIANELAAVSGRANNEVTTIDFFVAALIKESPSGKSVRNNVIEAILNELNITSEFKRMLVNEYNSGGNTLKIEGGEIVLTNKYKAESWSAENVKVSPQMKELFERAEKAKDFENKKKDTRKGGSFANSFKGLEHFFLGAMRMKGDRISEFLTNNIGTTGFGRFTFGKKRKNAKLNNVLDVISKIRGEGGRNGVTSRTAYEDYAQGNGKSFYSQKSEAEPPSFLNDMISKMIDGGYGPVHVRVDLVLDVARTLQGKGKNSVNIHSKFNGVGKKHIVLGLVKMLADIQVHGRKSEYYDILPRELHNLRLYEVDLTAYLGSKDNDTQFRGATEKSILEIKDFAENINGQVALVFNEMAGVYNLGQTQGSQGLGKQLQDAIVAAKNKPDKGLRVIAITNQVTGKEVSNTGWSQYVERITINEPNKTQVDEIAQIHFDKMKEDNPRIERESLNKVFDYVYEVSQRYPNLGDKLQAIFRIYDNIGVQLKETGQGRVTENHVLVAASTLLRGTVVEGGRYTPPKLSESLRTLETRLNNSIRERGELISAVVNKVTAGLYELTPVVGGVVRAKARSVTILVGPSGTLKTSIVELLAKRLGMEFDKIGGSQASESTLFDIAKKVREENPSRIVYISEANLARNIFRTLESMIDGTGITDPTTGKVTTFENVHFVLDGNIKQAETIARKYGFSETVPDALIKTLDSLRPRELETQMEQIKRDGEATFKDINGETQTVSISRHPHGVVKFTREGRRLYNEAVKDALGGREAFMGRAGEPIAVGYLSKNAYKATVDFVMDQQSYKFKKSNNGSELTITDGARDFIAEQATLNVNIEKGARFTTGYIEGIVNSRLRKEVWNNPLYTNEAGFFCRKI